MNTPDFISDDIIVAPATPAAPAALAIIRISGKGTFPFLQKAWKGIPIGRMKSHSSHLGYLLDENGEPLDQILLTIFRAPASFTGEDVAELSLHGSPWLLGKAMQRIVALGARPALPGEFSRRAFLNRRLDLSQAEAVADIIAASSNASRRLAISQLDGSYSRKFNQIRDSLLEIASLLELELDFGEEDVQFADPGRIRQLTQDAITLIENLADSFSLGDAFKNGIDTAIIGIPNAGKSSLLNTLLKTDKAIVSDIPGTTRDAIEATLEIGDLLFRITDTAGLRDTADSIERLGIERSIRALRKATLIIALIDPTAPLGQQFDTLRDAILQSPSSASPILLPVFTKQDLQPRIPDHPALSHPEDTPIPQEIKILPPIQISTKTGHNISQLRHTLATLFQTQRPDQEVIITNARHHHALRQASASLRRARALLDDSPASPELISRDIRQAAAHLSDITGSITDTDILTHIFSRFCIGK